MPKSFGKRPDGTEKGMGFLGLLERPDGSVSSEISVGVEIDGKELLIPTLVPTLSPDEVKFLLDMELDGNVKKIPESIMQKAVDHALQRMDRGQSPFFGPKFK